MNTNAKKLLSRKPAVIVVLLVICLLAMFKGSTAYATTVKDTVTDSTNDNGNNLSGALGPLEFTLNTDEDANSLSSTLQMLMVLTVISLAPSILIMVTSFTRIIIVLHFVRSALGLQTTPPNQVIIGLSLFLTFFIMSPIFTKVNNDAIQPLSKGAITQEEAWDAGVEPFRTFMLEQTRPKDLKLFLDIAGISTDGLESLNEIPITVIIPSFIISELQKAFIIGFVIYIPFIVIDMVVASTLMSMGMMMLPPTTISTPFKILLFIMADGWNLVIGEVVKTFYR
ncbi:MAG TPA: flagellar type III secretion system pore protein FliP [Clostridiales bacterium]|nr:flagellar type III secretion system pore protein FliP [Clostridiales bacterium]